MVNALDLMSRFSDLETSEIAIHTERCVVVRNRNASCRRCAIACTSGAISLNTNELAIDPEKCVGCGTCATVCPTAALEARNPTDSELLQCAAAIFRETDKIPVIACKTILEKEANRYDRSQVIEVGCLGRVEESELITLIALGLSPLSLAHSNCATCERATGWEVASLVHQTMMDILDAWGLENQITILDGLPDSVILSEREAKKTEDVDGLSRREFFAQLRRGTQDMAVQVAAKTLHIEEEKAKDKTRIMKVMKDGTLPHFIPNRRERMLDHLDMMGEARGDWLDTRLWGYLQIDVTQCNSCRMCATFCPTGAIVKFDDLGVKAEMGVEHYPADCVQCRLCEDVCPTKAVTINSKVSIRMLVEGDIIRHVMKPLEHKLNEPKQIYNAMYELLGGGQIYER